MYQRIATGVLVLVIVVVVVFLGFGFAGLRSANVAPTVTPKPLPTAAPTIEPPPPQLPIPTPDYYGRYTTWQLLDRPIAVTNNVYKVHVVPNDYYLVNTVEFVVGLPGQNICTLEYQGDGKGWKAYLTDDEGKGCS